MKTAGVRVAITRKTAASFADGRIRKTIAAALAGARRARPSEVSVTLVGDAEMRRLNRRTRRKDRTTDVLAFPNEGPSGASWPRVAGTRAFLGDIVVSVPQARRQAGSGFDREMAMLLVHGCLHLIGYDHEHLKDAKVMLPLQKKILRRLGYA